MTTKDGKIRIGVIFGGRSGEHDVSLVSAASIMKALDKDKYEIIPIGVTRTGNDSSLSIFEKTISLIEKQFNKFFPGFYWSVKCIVLHVLII